MARKPDPQKAATPAAVREDRLKAALKANMARRKAQSRARAETQTAETGGASPAGAEKDA